MRPARPRRLRRRRQRGAEALEFAASIGMLLVAVGAGAHVLEATRLEAAAEHDARVLARQAAVCDGTYPADLQHIDAGAVAAGATATEGQVAGRPGLFSETVRIPATGVLAVLGLHPAATVVMAREPGCS